MVAEDLDVSRLQHPIQPELVAGSQAGEELHGLVVRGREAGDLRVPLRQPKVAACRIFM